MADGGNEDITMSDGSRTKEKIPPDPPDPTKEKDKTQEKETCIYEASDEGPYILFVQGTNERGGGIERIHPMALGNIFKKLHPEIANKVERIYKNGKNRLKLVMKDRTSANILVTSEKMKQKGFLCFVPTFFVTKKGIIKGVFTDLSEDEIKKEIELPYELQNKIRVISVKRFNRKDNDQWIPTETVQVTFRAQQLPSHIILHYVRCKVEPFIPRVLQCSKCLRYGHSFKFCKSATSRCNTCGGDNHDTNACTTPPPPKCVHCQGEHKSFVENNKTHPCPEYKKQQEIKKIMTLENKTFLEARGTLKRQSYASTAAAGNTYTNNNNNYQSSISESNPSTPLPQASTSQGRQSNLFRKRRSDSQLVLDLNLQKQRDMYNSCNKNTYLPSSPIINNERTLHKSGNTGSQPSSPSLSTQNFSFNEKVRKTMEPRESNPKPNTEYYNSNLPKLILSVMKSVFSNEETKSLPESKLLIMIQNEIKSKSILNEHEFD